MISNVFKLTFFIKNYLLILTELKKKKSFFYKRLYIVKSKTSYTKK